VNANGAATVVTFEYGLDTGYGSTDPHVDRMGNNHPLHADGSVGTLDYRAENTGLLAFEVPGDQHLDERLAGHAES